MARLIQLRRLYWMAALLLLGYCVISARLVETQLVHGEILASEEQLQARARESHRPRRGEIRDVTGQLLAENVKVALVWADPTYVDLSREGLGDHRASVARLMEKHIGVPARFVYEQLALEHLKDKEGNLRFIDDDPSQPRYRQYKKLVEDVPMDRWRAFQQELKMLDVGIDTSKLSSEHQRLITNLRNYSVQAEQMWKRNYPEGRAASHILGFVNDEYEATATGTKRDMQGAYGVEKTLEDLLGGSWGYSQQWNYPKWKNHPALREDHVDAIDGWDVRLTIALQLQRFVESQIDQVVEKHDPDTVSVIVVRPRTGDILAMANHPTFDPNDRSQTKWENIKNRAISDFIDPGSVFKIVPIAAAMDKGIIDLGSTYFCEDGLWLYKGIPLKDDQHEFGTLNVREIVQHSSNIGTAKIALDLGPRLFYEYMRNFGFGSQTGVLLDGESGGMLNEPSKWDGITITRVAIGQSVGVTPLQMVMAYSAIANDGVLMRPRLVDGVARLDGNFQTYPVETGRQVVRPETARMVTEALKAVMTDGTGRNAALDGYVVAGKTGTAQQAGTDRNGRFTMKSGKYAATFIGFFPADDPQVCISVVVNNPKKGSIYGGSTAAPVWKRIAEETAHYLHIQPDIVPEHSNRTEAWNRAVSPARRARF